MFTNTVPLPHIEGMHFSAFLAAEYMTSSGQENVDKVMYAHYFQAWPPKSPMIFSSRSPICAAGNEGL